MAASRVTAATEMEAEAVRKVRVRIVPFVFLLMVIAFLDRINVGFAALTMNKELALTSQQFGLLSGIFFWGYFLFEIPSNLLLHKIGARIWMTRILISWGVVAVLTGLVQTAMHLYALRFLLGVAEAGYFPGIILYLTYWFRQKQLAQTFALFAMAIPVANIIGAPLSGAILDHVHWLGLSSWRWLLILEGVPALLGGALTYVLLPSRPAEAKFLSNDEKQSIAVALASEERQKAERGHVRVLEALAYGRVWHLTAIYFTAIVGQYTMTFWMPLLIQGGTGTHSNATVGVLVMVPYLAALGAMMLTGRSSDKSNERRYHAALPLIAGAVSFLLLGGHSTGSVVLTVALWSIVASAINSFWAPFWALPNEFLAGFSAAAGIALINSLGNLGGFVGPYAMGAANKMTGSFRGGLAFAGLSWFLSAALLLLLPRRTQS
jgi:MFS transporter, ACS family, tartrate transporter